MEERFTLSKNFEGHEMGSYIINYDQECVVPKCLLSAKIVLTMFNVCYYFYKCLNYHCSECFALINVSEKDIRALLFVLPPPPFKPA